MNLLNDNDNAKCLNGHIMERDVYICWKCGSHIETDIQKWVRIALKKHNKLQKEQTHEDRNAMVEQHSPVRKTDRSNGLLYEEVPYDTQLLRGQSKGICGW